MALNTIKAKPKPILQDHFFCNKKKWPYKKVVSLRGTKNRTTVYFIYFVMDSVNQCILCNLYTYEKLQQVFFGDNLRDNRLFRTSGVLCCNRCKYTGR